MSALPEIPELYPVTRQVITAQDALRDRIIELEDALRGVVALFDTLAESDLLARYSLGATLRLHPKYVEALRVLS